MSKGAQIVLGIVLTALIGVMTTFMWRADDKLYDLVQAQTKLAGEIKTLTVITGAQLEEHKRYLDDHEERLRSLEK